MTGFGSSKISSLSHSTHLLMKKSKIVRSRKSTDLKGGGKSLCLPILPSHQSLSPMSSTLLTSSSQKKITMTLPHAQSLSNFRGARKRMQHKGLVGLVVFLTVSASGWLLNNSTVIPCPNTLCPKCNGAHLRNWFCRLSFGIGMNLNRFWGERSSHPSWEISWMRLKTYNKLAHSQHPHLYWVKTADSSAQKTSSLALPHSVKSSWTCQSI